MSAHPIVPVNLTSAPAKTARRWRMLPVGAAMAGGCAMVALLAAASAPAGFLIGMAWQQAAASQPSFAFDSRTSPGGMQFLRGVSGETVVEGATAQAELADFSPAGMLDKTAITPAALDRLSAGDCISLTTASGQKLSFRIVGAHKGEPSRNRGAASNIDLAVTACSATSEVILKAVIESKADARQSAVQRNL